MKLSLTGWSAGTHIGVVRKAVFRNHEYDHDAAPCCLLRCCAINVVLK